MGVTPGIAPDGTEAVARLAALVAQAQAGSAGWERVLEEAERQVLAVHGSGTADVLLAPLEAVCRACPDQAAVWWLLGLALHDVQRHEQALQALDRAATLQPTAAILLAQAQLHYETGRPAAARYASLRSVSPEDPRVVRNLAGALAAEGDPRAAEQVLLEALARHPGWLEGQQRLATLRQTSGWPDFDAGYAAAVRSEPRNRALRMGWFAELAKARQWEAAGRVIHDAARELGEHPQFVMARLYLEAESGAACDRPDLFADLPAGTDPGLGLARVRHALRCGRPEQAAAVAEAFVTSAAAPMFWPYLSVAWRLMNDDRADWLDRPDTFVRATQLDLGSAELADLAALLRSLHIMAAPYLEQSVRGGTQTDRPLLFRHEPLVARLRAAILAAVRDYVDGLPPAEAGHPLLSPPRDRLRFAGSWSVRLRDQGFHACHTHPAGWISSACYIALPHDMGAPPAGWLRFGTPPPELGLQLAPYHVVAPRVGQLVLFPSTMWHGTAPFHGGERLTVAFDLRVPG